MENATKALIIAGGILIGVLIISLGVYLFIDFGSKSVQIHDQNVEKQMLQFNSKFTVYIGKTNVNIYDIISLAGYAKENNEYYDDSNTDELINVLLNGESISENLDINSYIDKYKDKNFKFFKINYNNRGKVKEIYFINN